MLSQDIRNLARVFDGFGALDGSTELTPAQLRTFAWSLGTMAEQAERLEAHTVPAQARLTPGNRPANVIDIPRSKPWGGHKRTPHRPPEGGAA